MGRPLTESEFWDKADRSGGPGACWNWLASVDTRGYGNLSRFGKMARAHRVAWEFVYGPIPVGAYCLHRCDNRRCINPAHLFLGTHDDNMSDMVSKGRQRGAPGDSNGSRLHPASRARGDEHWSRRMPERRATGERNGSIRHPERLARGDRNGSRLHPESRPRGEVHWTRTNPGALARGESHGNAKLTEDDVRYIRRCRADRSKSYAELASELGVTSGLIGHIARGVAWAHVKD